MKKFSKMLGFLLLSVLMVVASAAKPDKIPNERSVRIPIKDKPVVFPDDKDDAPSPSQPVPEDVLIRMTSLQNEVDFWKFVGHSPNYSTTPGTDEEGVPINGSDVNGTTDIYNRKGLSGAPKVPAQAAGCEIEMQAIELDRPNDPSIVIWPTCTRLPRCGGCCTSTLLQCVPTKVSKMEIQVLQARYKGKSNGQFDVLGVIPQKVEKHEKCQCECIEKAEHCTPLQSYRQEECKCICTNSLLRKSCTGNDHIWDPKLCQCVCRETHECSSEFFYSLDSCRCEVLKTSRLGGIRKSAEVATHPPTTTTTTTTIKPALMGHFEAPMAHLNGGEKGNTRQVSLNTKPYDSEDTFTLAQSGKPRASRRMAVPRSRTGKPPQARVDSAISEQPQSKP